LELSNGVRVQVLRTPPALEGSRGLASVQLWLASGTRDEGPEHHGAAHMLEHMVFRPWGPAEGEDLANSLEARGGEVNAYTSHDETVFHATLPADEAEVALRALSRAVLDRDFAEGDYEREREVVVEEIRQYEDDAAAVVGDSLLAQLYPNDGYGRPILGSESSLRAMSVRSLMSHYRRHYVGRRLGVVVVGTVSPKRIFKLAQELFASLPAGRARARGKRWPRPVDASLATPRVPGTDVPVRIAWAGPSIVHDDAVALDLLAVCLGQGESSRLSVALRYRESLALDAHASYLVGARGGSFNMSATCTVEQAEACVAEMRAEAQRLREEAPTEAELTRARAMLRSSLVYRKETVQGQAHALGYYLIVGGDPELETHYFECLDRLTRADLLRAARRYLDPGVEQVNVGMPRDALGRKELGAYQRRMRRRLLARVDGKPKPKPKLKHRNWERPRTSLWCHDFGSGLRLRVHRDRKLPLAAGWIAWPGGQRLEPGSRAGVGSLAAGSLGRAAPGRAPLEIGRWLDGHAALLDGFFGRSSMGLALESTSDCFAELVDLALDCTVAPSFDAGELERQRQTAREDLQAQLEDPSSIAVRAALRGLYGKHPQARPLRGDIRVVERAGVAQLDELMRRQHWGDAIISVAGDVDPEALARRVEARLGPSRLSKEARNSAVRRQLSRLEGTPSIRKRAKRIECVRPDAAQSQIVLAYPGVAQSDPRRMVMDLMCEYLGSQTGPLFFALREQRGLVYHVGIAASSGLDAGHVLVHAAASPLNFDEASGELDRVLERFLDEGPDTRGLEQARSTLAGYFSGLWQRRARVASLLARSELRGRGAAAAYELIDALAQVRREDVVELSREVFRRKARVVSIVRGQS
jgi:zinc protease